MNNENNKRKDIVFEAIIGFLSTILTTIFNKTTNLNIVLQIIICLVTIGIIILLLQLFKRKYTDIRAYDKIKKDLPKIGAILDNLDINDHSVPEDYIESIDIFIEEYNPNRTYSFKDIYANLRLKKLLYNLIRLNRTLIEYQIKNGNSGTFRVRFEGYYGDYNQSQIENSRELQKQRIKYSKLLKKCIKDYKKFRMYCENRYQIDDYNQTK